MKASHQNLWHKLEKKRIDLMQELAQYDKSVFNVKPQPNAWSVNQVLLHLIDAERKSHQYIEKKLSYGVNIPKAGFISTLRRRSLSWAFALPIKYKAPKGLDVFPEVSDFDDLKNRWASERLDLRYLLERMPDKVAEGEIWKHAFAGKMTIAQMLDFFCEHFDRHKIQIERTIKTVQTLSSV